MTITLRNALGVDIHEQKIEGIPPNVILLRDVVYHRVGVMNVRALFVEGSLLKLDDSTKLTPPETALANSSTGAETGAQKAKESSRCS